MRPILFGLALAMPILANPLGQCAAEDLFAGRLKQLHIEPTPQGVENFLKSLRPDGNRDRHVRELIAKLGSAEFAEREQAMRALGELPIPPVPQLEKAAHSGDLEIQARAKRLLAKAAPHGYQTSLGAVLQFIEHRKLKGLAPLLLPLFPELKEPDLLRRAERALRTTVQADDATLLRRRIATQPPPEREAALLALGAALGDEAVPELLPFLEHAEASMRLAAAEGLADLGQRSALSVLVALLESPDVEHRQRSAAILRALTGQRMGFSAGGDVKLRTLAANSWKKWLAEQGSTAKLTFPFRRQHMELGRTLVCIWGSKILKEFSADRQGMLTVAGFKYVWGCHATLDGRRLAVDAEQKAIFEYDENGSETWRRINLPGRPTGVQALPNGHVLVACSDSNQVVEISRDGQIVWDFAIEGRPTTAQRLENGHTVINLQNAGEVVEVDSQGNLRKLVTGLDRAHTAQFLDNGNVLVTEMRLNRVDEYDRNGNIVWSKTNLRNPSQAQRLSNGNTLIADENGLHEFDPNTNRVWHLKVSRSRFYRY